MAPRTVTRDEQIIGGPELAKRLNISNRRLFQLVEDGVIVKAERGRYYLWQSVTGYINFLQDSSYSKALRHGAAPGAEPDEEEGGDGTPDINREKAKLQRAKRIAAELELAVQSGQLHRATDVERYMVDMLSGFRAAVLAMPTEAARHLLGKENIADIKAVLEKFCRKTLTKLAGYDKQKLTPKELRSALADNEEE